MSIFVALFKIKLLLYFNVNNIYMKYFNKKNEKNAFWDVVSRHATEESWDFKFQWRVGYRDSLTNDLSPLSPGTAALESLP